MSLFCKYIMVDSYYLYAESYEALKIRTPQREIRNISRVFIKDNTWRCGASKIIVMTFLTTRYDGRLNVT